MKKHLTAIFCLTGLLIALPAPAAEVPFLDPADARHLAEEVSGDRVLALVETITQHHRIRGSVGLTAAIADVRATLDPAQFETIEVLRFPTDGVRMYGTQRGRQAWNANFAELWLMIPDGDGWQRSVRLASWDDMPVSLAQDSESGTIQARLVDIGAGTSEDDYADLDIAGNIVLTSSQPGAVQELAIGQYGAAAIVSYTLNQPSAWRDDELGKVRWGHLSSFNGPETFAFMITPSEAAQLRERLAAGETIMLNATVDAGRSDGAYEILTAQIAGTDPDAGEIVFSCHLDHQRPGANDNASGCATIAEIARVLASSIASGAIERPRRGLRFIWPPEIEGTITLLAARPDLAANIRATLHLDMVGGNPERTGAIFRIDQYPSSLPTIAPDVAALIAHFVEEESVDYASGNQTDYALTASRGSRHALQVRDHEFGLGSDHQIYIEGSWRIPSAYYHDYPDRDIHTDHDTAANLDATKLGRVAFMAAVAGLALAGAGDAEELGRAFRRGATIRAASLPGRLIGQDADHAANILFQHWQAEYAAVEDIARFVPENAASIAQTRGWLGRLEAAFGTGVTLPYSEASAAMVYNRNPAIMGPMSGFGYSFYDERVSDLETDPLADEVPPLHQYEALNLVDGERTVGDIHAILIASYGDVSLAAVAAYLATLAQIDVLFSANIARETAAAGMSE